MPDKNLLSRPWLWAHVLSLEAPAVAVLWTAALARLHNSKMPPGVLAGLALTVWVVYLVDRVFDTFGAEAAQLDARHAFYWRHRTWILGGVVPVLAGMVVWLALFSIPAGLFAEALVLLPALAVYLVVYTHADTRALRKVALAGAPCALLVLHALPLTASLRMAGTVLVGVLALLAWSPRLRSLFQKCLRKESAAGVVFALGCTTYARFNHQGARDQTHWIELLLLAFLFTGNLTLISQQERPASQRRDPRGFLYGCVLFSAWLGYGGFWRQDSSSLHLLAGMVMAGLLLHVLVWLSARGRSAESFRFWADAALLLPPLWLWLR